jgi:RNA polymerase sigma factor (sigma-70 family)
MSERESSELVSSAEWLDPPRLGHVAARVAYQRGLGRDDLSDLIQEIRIALWEAGPTVRVPEAWLHQVARHKAIDIIRQRGRRRQRDREARYSRGQPTTDAKAELDHLLHVSVAGLPARLRRFYTLRYENGYTQREIAASLGVCRATVRWLDRCCRRHLVGRV